MNLSRLSAELDLMVAEPGIVGCALVDANTGLVWHARARNGVANADRLWEAAVDYWRLHDRQSLHFAYAAALGQRHALLVALAIPGRCVYEQKKAASVLRFHVVDAHGHAERVVIRAPFLRHVPEHRRELGCLQQTRIDVGATGSRAGQA